VLPWVPFLSPPTILSFGIQGRPSTSQAQLMGRQYWDLLKRLEEHYHRLPSQRCPISRVTLPWRFALTPRSQVSLTTVKWSMRCSLVPMITPWAASFCSTSGMFDSSAILPSTSRQLMSLTASWIYREWTVLRMNHAGRYQIHSEISPVLLLNCNCSPWSYHVTPNMSYMLPSYYALTV